MRKVFFTACAMLPLSIIAGFSYAEETKGVQLERIVVTPTRSAKATHETASNVTIIDSEDIKNSVAKNVADVLKNEAGVLVAGYSGNRKTVKVDIRGFGETATSNVLVLIDGRKVNQIDMSGADWIQLPIEAIDRIEVLRGSSSVLYGDNAVGGVVNIITRRGRGGLKGATGVSYGSYNTFSGFGEASGSIEDFSYYVNSKYSDSKGYRENNALRTKDFNGRFGYPLFERLMLDLSLGWHKDSYGMPGALSESNLADLGRRQSTYMEDRALTKDEYARLLIDTDPIFGGLEIGRFTNDLSFRHRKTYTSSVAWGVNSISQNNIHTLSFNSKYEKNIEKDANNIRIVLGIDYSDANNEVSGRGWSVDEIDISKESTGAYLYCEDKLFDKIIISSGCRYEKNRYIFDQSSEQVKYTKRKPSESVIQASLAYLYNKDSSFFWNYKQSFRFPATDEWYVNSGPNLGLNEALNPQEGEQYELGIKHDFFGTSTLNAVCYLMNIKNEIYYNPSTYFNENYGKTRHAGIELGMTSVLSERTKIFTNYTFERARLRGGNYNDSDIPAVPRNKFNAGLRIQPAEACILSLVGNYVGRRYMISDQKNQVPKMDDYVTVDAKMICNVTCGKDNDIEISFAINNIFNEKYSEYGVTNSTGTTKNYYPSPERNFEVGVTYKF